MRALPTVFGPKRGAIREFIVAFRHIVQEALSRWIMYLLGKGAGPVGSFAPNFGIGHGAGLDIWPAFRIPGSCKKPQACFIRGFELGKQVLQAASLKFGSLDYGLGCFDGTEHEDCFKPSQAKTLRHLHFLLTAD